MITEADRRNKETMEKKDASPPELKRSLDFWKLCGLTFASVAGGVCSVGFGDPWVIFLILRVRVSVILFIHPLNMRLKERVGMLLNAKVARFLGMHSMVLGKRF